MTYSQFIKAFLGGTILATTSPPLTSMMKSDIPAPSLISSSTPRYASTINVLIVSTALMRLRAPNSVWYSDWARIPQTDASLRMRSLTFPMSCSPSPSVKFIGVRTFRPSSRRCLWMITACSPFENGRKGIKAEMRPVTGDYSGPLAEYKSNPREQEKTGYWNIPRGERGSLAWSAWTTVSAHALSRTRRHPRREHSCCWPKNPG